MLSLFVSRGARGPTCSVGSVGSLACVAGRPATLAEKWPPRLTVVRIMTWSMPNTRNDASQFLACVTVAATVITIVVVITIVLVVVVVVIV